MRFIRDEIKTKKDKHFAKTLSDKGVYYEFGKATFGTHFHQLFRIDGKLISTDRAPESFRTAAQLEGQEVRTMDQEDLKWAVPSNLLIPSLCQTKLSKIS